MPTRPAARAPAPRTGPVATVFHGDLTGVLGEYWSAETSLKNELFWAHRQCLDRLASVCEAYGIEVASISEAWISPHRRVRHVASATGHGGIASRCGARVASKGTRTSPPRRRCSTERRTPRAGRRHGPCGSSGTTTSGSPLRGTRWGPTNSAQTRKVPPWCHRDTSERALRERQVDVDPLVARFSDTLSGVC
jgi:hypothetical protein